MIRPRCLDLFCKAGGASKGYADAGFDVTGVDIEPQPRYVHGPEKFIQADALEVLADLDFVRSFDFIAASPPCQNYTWASACRRNAGHEYPDLVSATREGLERSDRPYAIENVLGAPLRPDILLTGPMVGLNEIWRRRVFELGGWLTLGPTKAPMPKKAITVAGHWFNNRDGSRAMGIDWMRNGELANAVPPAYAEWIGRRFLTAREAAA